MANSVISTNANGGTVIEGNAAVVTYHLSSPLGRSTTVGASVIGVGATAVTDYGDLYYHMGNNAASGWTKVVGGVITLGTGFDDFQLKVDVVHDNTVELPLSESLFFVVSQTAGSLNIQNSWWVCLLYTSDAADE